MKTINQEKIIFSYKNNNYIFLDNNLELVIFYCEENNILLNNRYLTIDFKIIKEILSYIINTKYLFDKNHICLTNNILLFDGSKQYYYFSNLYDEFIIHEDNFFSRIKNNNDPKIKEIIDISNMIFKLLIDNGIEIF